MTLIDKLAAFATGANARAPPQAEPALPGARALPD